MKTLQVLILILITGFCTAQSNSNYLKTNKDDNTLLWEISGNGLKQPGYLFGTFHLLCKDDIKFSNPLLQAITNSKEIYLELDMDNPSTLFGGLMLMNMKQGKKLKDLFTADEYKRISAYFKDSLQIPIGLFQTVKPYFIVAMLYPKMMPCKSISGVEEEIMKLAKAKNKEIRGLETMAFQSALFDSIPYETQATELLNAVDSMAKSRLYFDSMIIAYKNQQLQEIEKLLASTEFGVEENQDILLDKRNKNWVAQLKGIMKKEPVFVAVGTGHLIGKTGLIALMRKEGYMVRPLENK